MTRIKIENAYNVALKLGLKNATDFERSVFKLQLHEIAMAAFDEAKNISYDLLDKESQKYRHSQNSNNPC